MAFDRLYLVTALIYALAGMSLGIMMAATQSHGQHVTHTHILLVGFVVSFIYAVIHKLWLARAPRAVGSVQFWLHQVGALVMVVALFMLYGGRAPLETLEPVLASASIAVLLAMIMMLVMVLVPAKSSADSQL
ncbi:MAG: TonB-dependent receptor [Xanthomonadaceae bacterium]|nr:TonB-dependent receptor [Xanthomonadaceae bacterium]